MLRGEGWPSLRPLTIDCFARLKAARRSSNSSSTSRSSGRPIFSALESRRPSRTKRRRRRLRSRSAVDDVLTASTWLGLSTVTTAKLCLRSSVAVLLCGLALCGLQSRSGSLAIDAATPWRGGLEGLVDLEDRSRGEVQLFNLCLGLCDLPGLGVRSLDSFPSHLSASPGRIPPKTSPEGGKTSSWFLGESDPGSICDCDCAGAGKPWRPRIAAILGEQYSLSASGIGLLLSSDLNNWPSSFNTLTSCIRLISAGSQLLPVLGDP